MTRNYLRVEYDVLIYFHSYYDKTEKSQIEFFSIRLSSNNINDNITQQVATVSRSIFYLHRCPRVSAPVKQSCVDIYTISLVNYMRGIGKFIRNNKMIKRKLEECKCAQHQIRQVQQWQAYLSKRGEDLVEISCCSKIIHPYLSYGVGSSARTPKLLQRKCVNKECDRCGVDRKLKMKECRILGECKQIIDVIEWIHTPRQGKKSVHKRHTFLRLITLRHLMS